MRYRDPMSRSTGRSRLAYSTDRAVKCSKCGWPLKDCRCGERPPEAVPERIVAKLRLETKGRKGKGVTVIYDLPRNPEFLEKVATELKKACAAGGAVGETTVEVQGDHRETIRARLEKKGWTVKG